MAAVLVSAGLGLGASQGEPYETASPFVGLSQLPEVSTSNDEYSVWWAWPTTTARLVVGRWTWGVDASSDEDCYATATRAALPLAFLKDPLTMTNSFLFLPTREGHA